MANLQRLRQPALCAIGGGLFFAVIGFFCAPSYSASCPDERPGLWLRFVDGQPHLSGRVPVPVKIVAMESAVSFWGYPRSTVCSSGNVEDPTWMSLTEAVYRAPLANLHSGEVLVQPDLVVIAGETSSRARREEIESAIRANLAAAGLAAVPKLVRIGVSTDPALVRRIAAHDLRFAADSAELSPDASYALNGIVQELRRIDAPIVVVGHADATGRAARNGELSQWRADTVRFALIKSGIAPQRITALGEGDRMPVADNATEPGRAANRRVTIALGAIDAR